ncbi:MAG: SusC/RagA family protein, partial [Phocaeicola sp.]
VATMESSGLEFTLSTRNIVTKNFKWNTDFIYSHAKNKITELDNRSRVIDLVSGSGFGREGYAVRSLFSIPFMGLNDEGIPTFLDQSGNVTTTGIYFQERDNIDFLEYSGSVDPTDFGSLGNMFSYKNWKLNVFMTYSFGNVVRLDPVFKSSYSDLSSMPKEFKNRWVVSGDENITNVPVIASTMQNRNNSQLSYAYNAYNYSTERIAKGDFIRMKEISVVYDFSDSVINRLKLSNLSLKLQATNLFLIYADKKLNGQDPEFYNTGGVAAPVPRQFTLTLRVGL